MTRRLSTVACGLLASAWLLHAQQSAADKTDQTDTGAPTTLKAEAKLVNLPVVIRDKKGALVNTFKKEDFTLQVDQKPQVVRYFDLDNDLPLTLGLLVDVSGSMRNQIDEERTASAAFLDSMLKNGPDGQPRDNAFLIQFAARTELLQDVTGSRPKLQAALKDIEASNDPVDPSGKDTDSEGRKIRRGGTVLYDAAFLAADEITSKIKGRKALILLTDGADRNSKETLATAIETAQRGDTTIYAIYFKGEQPRQQYNNNQNNNGGRRGGGGGYPGIGYPGGGGGYPGGGGGYPGGNGGGNNGGGNNGGNRPQSQPKPNVDGKKVLERMAGETGGRVFEVSKKEPLADIYKQIGEELRAQYRLAFTPDIDRASSGYHLVDLSLTDKKYKGYTVQTRDGYYPPK